MHSRWLPREAGRENAKSVQRCQQGKGWLLWRILNIKYLDLFITSLVSTCVLFQNSKKLKTLEWVGVSEVLTGTVYLMI